MSTGGGPAASTRNQRRAATRQARKDAYQHLLTNVLEMTEDMHLYKCLDTNGFTTIDEIMSMSKDEIMTELTMIASSNIL